MLISFEHVSVSNHKKIVSLHYGVNSKMNFLRAYSGSSWVDVRYLYKEFVNKGHVIGDS